MSFVTFIYRIAPSKHTYFGKYIFHEYLLDDHNGLDMEIRQNVVDIINHYRLKNNETYLSSDDITIGILSFTTNDGAIQVYSSKDEIGAFDFYYESNQLHYSDSTAKAYINGKLV